jgi:hypothetical protein
MPPATASAIDARPMGRLTIMSQPKSTSHGTATVARVPTHCSACKLREVCLPCG